MLTNVDLTPDLERFARECVDDGRYASMDEVVLSGLRLLREREEHRHRFEAMLREAEAETDREGSISVESVLEKMDHIIAARER